MVNNELLMNHTPCAAPYARGLACPDYLAHICLMLADEQTTPEQLAIFRRMTPEQRWRAA